MTRKGLAILLAMGVLFGATARAADGAMAVIDTIYALAVQDKGPSWIYPGEREEYLSKSLVDLWARTDAARPEDDELGAIDFDIVTDTNGMTLGSYNAVTEREDANTAAIAVTLNYSDAAPDQESGLVHYDFVHEDGIWKIDNIHSSNWDLRQMLENYIAENPKK